MLDLESEAMRGPGPIPTGSNILSLDFFSFHTVKTKMPIMAFSYSLRKTLMFTSFFLGTNIFNGSNDPDTFEN